MLQPAYEIHLHSFSEIAITQNDDLNI